ncbi:MAG TPA: hypothetical protein PK513_01110 [Alphaproteobacteria bacterium]|nr:hypothetical protein [Alphaproteobacteria bacterium]USO04774.1 MAG: hypothetical protein H6859_06295 [Rhodospirillales bacterium]HOO81086.1 hypothetical protein [Alphaproteobacteria bacterium]
MGSLSSRSSVPRPTPQVVYVPQTTNTTTSAAESAASAVSVGEMASQVRTQNLLGRERSRFGTVLTGFRGLLSTLEDHSPRKTLLGE